MSNDVAKKAEDEICNLDGFDGFIDEADGEDQDQLVGGRVIQGTRINFTNEAIWIDAAKEELPSDLELIVVDIGRVVQKWGKDNRPSRTADHPRPQPEISGHQGNERGLPEVRMARVVRQLGGPLSGAACRLHGRPQDDG